MAKNTFKKVVEGSKESEGRNLAEGKGIHETAGDHNKEVWPDPLQVTPGQTYEVE